MSRTLVSAVLAATLLGPACTSAEEPAKVEVGHNRVEPASVTIAAGESVIFHNQDAMPGGHTIVAEDGSFSSPPLAEDEIWTHTFSEPGTVRFRIQQHPDAKGTIVVQ